jgi:small subunit ribosomal protein S4
MSDAKCKRCRRAGQKLFLKEEKCFGPKCTMVRKPYPPGKRAKRPHSPKSEYGLQLQEKQSLKFLYGLREKQFVNYVKKAMKGGGANISSRLIKLLEARLDNVVYKMGLSQSRSGARQIISHGHICVNGRKVTIPSYSVKKGDKISIRKQSASRKVFADLDVYLKKYNTPTWIKLDKATKKAEITKEPETDNLELGVDINSIIEFYSR